MVMKQIIQTTESHRSGGFSDTRLRIYLFGFMNLGLIMAPFLGMFASFIVVLIFGVFTAFKISEFQQSNRKSILLHNQAMDRMYNNGSKAEYYKMLLKPYEKKITPKAVKTQKTRQVKNVNGLSLALNI
jgi:hypothetical protein